MIQVFQKNKKSLSVGLNWMIMNKQLDQGLNSRQVYGVKNYMFSETKVTKQDKESASYRLHEVKFISFKDSRDQFDQLLESKYYNDSDEGRLKFMENKQGINRCAELKYKIDYIMRLPDKEMYQQKKVNEMIQIAIKYMENIKRKFDNLDEKKQQEVVYFLRNIHEVMEYMNILDLNMWRVYFETIVLVSKKKSYNYHFTILLSSIDKFCKRFYNLSCDVFREKIVFRQDDLPNVITPKLINQLLSNMEKCPITDPNPKSFVLSMYYLSTIIWKVSKASQILLSGYHRTQFYLKYQEHAMKILPSIDMNEAVSLYFAFSVSGVVNKELSSAFNNYFLTRLSELKHNQHLQAKIIDMWAITGYGCQELYQVFEPKRVEFIQNNTDIAQILRQLALASQTNLKVSQTVIKQVIHILATKTELANQISSFQLEILFNHLIYFNITMPDVITKEFINSSIFSYMLEYMKSNHSLQIDQGGSKESILDLKPLMQSMNTKFKTLTDGLKYDKDDDVNNVNNASLGFKQEHLCSKSLLYWLSLQNLQDEFIIFSNYKIYLYELDLLVYSKKQQKFVAIEISGNNYTNSDGSLVGKRLLKHRILEAYGITIKYFSVTEDKIYNNAISLEASRKVSRIYIAEQIFKLIEDSLGQEYPKIDLKKKKFVTKTTQSEIESKQQQLELEQQKWE